METLLLLSLVIIAVILFLLLLGVYGDMAKRTGFPITNRTSFLLAPVLYAITILVAFLPVVYFVFYPLFLMDLNSILRLAIPFGLLVFGLLITIGALPLWLLNRKTTSFKKCIVLSARLMLSPVIDAFWASVAVFVGIIFAIPAFFISSLITLYRISQFETDMIGIIGYVLSPNFSDPFIIVFLIFGLVSAYFILKRGPSEVVSKYFYFTGIGVLVASVLASLVLFLSFGNLALIIAVPIFFAGLSLFLVCQIISSLFKALRIAGVFGLTITVLSIFFLAAVYGATRLLEDIPVVGSMILEMMPPVLWTVALEVGVVGIVAGIIIIILARRTEEKGQVITRAMAISIGISSFMPLFARWIFLFFNLVFLSGLLGALAGVFLTFFLIGPIYVIAVLLLRLGLAFHIIVKPPDQQLATKKKEAQSRLDSTSQT